MCNLDKIDSFKCIYASRIGFRAVAFHEFDTFLSGFVFLPLVSRNIFTLFQTYHSHLLCSETESCAGCVHSYGTAADHNALFANDFEILMRHTHGILIIICKIHELNRCIDCIIVPLRYPCNLLAVRGTRCNDHCIVLFLQFFDLLLAERRIALNLKSCFL